jgi:hypothetical protein
MLSPLEQARLRALIRATDLAAAEDVIVARAQPMVLIALPEQHERDARATLDRLPIGASRFGGPPDLPAGFEWPHFALDNPLHFHSQIDLASVPAIPGSPLPATGMLYVFVGLPGDYALEARLYHADTPKTALRRTPRPTAAADQLSMEYYVAEFEPFPLVGTVGIDFVYRSADGSDLLDEILARVRPADPQSVYDRFDDLTQRAADSHHAARQASGYPLRWWQVMQLFGATNPVQAADSAARHLEANGGSSDDAAVTRERARWRRLLSLDSNSLIGFESLTDARPYRVLVRESAMPWRSFEHVDTHTENG